MKYLLLSSVLLSSLAMAAGTYAPNDGSARPGNPGASIKTENPGPRAMGTAYSNDSLRKREEITKRTGVSTSELNPSVNPVPAENSSETFEKSLTTEKEKGKIKTREIQAQEVRSTKPVGE